MLRTIQTHSTRYQPTSAQDRDDATGHHDMRNSLQVRDVKIASRLTTAPLCGKRSECPNRWTATRCINGRIKAARPRASIGRAERVERDGPSAGKRSGEAPPAHWWHCERPSGPAFDPTTQSRTGEGGKAATTAPRETDKALDAERGSADAFAASVHRWP